MDLNLRAADARRLYNELSRHVFVAALACVVSIGTAHSAEIDTGSEVKLRWDNTIKYSTGIRALGQDAKMADAPATAIHLSGNDGDRSFKQGDLISNRLDLLSELNMSYRDFGFRVSGAAWYDDVYNRRHASVPAGQYNASSVDVDEFTTQTRVAQGKNVELQDAFLFGKGEVGSTPVRFRAGRHTLLWGESLFLASNGIAFGQAPIDVAKASGVPNTQAKEVFMPVGQLSAQIQPSNDITLEAYWQPEWRANRLPSAGSYFSTSDFLGDGAERILVPGYTPGVFPLSNLYLQRGKDIQPNGLADQMGVALKYRADAIDTDFGFYALMYDDKNAQVYGNLPSAGPGFPVAGAGEYHLVYAENIRMYGVSASTQVSDWNVGGEVSYRQNTPFLSGDRGLMVGVPYGTGNGTNHRYATGDSLHAQMSGILLLGPSRFWEGGSLVGEVGGHRIVSIDTNPDMLDRSRSRQALGTRVVFEPSYFQVAPAVDMSIPIGLGYTVGQSPLDMGFNNGAPDRGGDISFGIKADYAKTWFGSLNYTHYYGRDDQQFLLGRDFVSLSVQRTF